MKLFSTPWKRWTIGSLLAVLILAVGFQVGRLYVWPAIKVRRIEGMNRDAQNFYASGDLANALLIARKSLQSTTENPNAWRVAVAVTKSRQVPEVIYYQENLCRAEPTNENYLELARLALRFEALNYALDAIKVLGARADARSNPDFHRLAADVFLRARQPTSAKYHLVALTELRPADGVAQLDLAELELLADPARKDLALRERIKALAAQPELRARALSLLLRENLKVTNAVGTDILVRDLKATAGIGVSERLLVVEGLHLIGSPDAEVQLAELQKEVVNNAADSARVLEFLTRSGQPKKAATWYTQLPEQTRKDEEIKRLLAESLLAAKDWTALEAHLRAGPWAKREYLRQALLAYTYRSQNRSVDFAEAWKLALIDAGTDIRKTTALITRVEEWKWVTERYALAWKLFSLVPNNQAVRDALISWENLQGNTANLQRLFTRIVEVDSKNTVARNNVAYTSLLLDTNTARAGLIANELVAAEPKNPFFVTTYALARYRQGQVAEALARIDSLSAAERSAPIRILLRALFLARLGRTGESADLMSGVVQTGLLPEEKQLGQEALREIAKVDQSRGNLSRLLAFQNSKTTATGKSGWLPLVASTTRATATTDMQLADSLYAAADWNGLFELVRSADWKGENYLRSVILSYLYRRQGDLQQSDISWRQALASADRNVSRVQNLQALVTEWGWTPQRVETLNIIFERTPSDRSVLAELLENYRTSRRAPDMLRVLDLYVSGNADIRDEAVMQAYYSLLLESNVPRAHVTARNAFELAPGDELRRLVYIFSLWKQRRSSEAKALLKDFNPSAAATAIVPIHLLRAAISADLGLKSEARQSLALFDGAQAMPEEAALGNRIAALLPDGDSARTP